jgi:hypothetical protein
MKPTPTTDAAESANSAGAKPATEQWFYHADSRTITTSEQRNFGCLIATLPNTFGGHGTADTVKRGHLIAAAPELLEVLKITRGNVNTLCGLHPAIYSEWLRGVDAVIAKAEGA